MSARPARLGLIGAGRWGRNYIRTLTNLPDQMTLAMVASKNPETAALVPNECTVLQDWRQVATAGNLDGVIIATPPELHVRMAEAAVTTGLPVLVEKPLCMSVAEAEHLLGLATERNGFVLVGHTQLFSPAFRTLKTARKGLGQIRWIRAEAGRPAPPDFDVPVLWNWGCHDVAMCLDLLGENPSEASAIPLGRCMVDGRPAENVGIRLKFPSGVSARIDVGNLVEKKRRIFAVQFESELWVYNDYSSTKLMRHRGVHDPEAMPTQGEPVPIPSGAPLTVAVQEFAQAVQNGRHDHKSLELGVAIVRLLERCEKSLS